MRIEAEEFKRKQIYEQVAERILVEIKNGSLKIGDRLPSERDLAVKLGVSRPSVREAIGALQNMGWVETRPGSGTYINQPARDVDSDVIESLSALQFDQNKVDTSPVSVFEVVLHLEPIIAKIAAAQQCRDPLIEQYLKEMSELHNMNDPIQRRKWDEYDRLFHRQIAVMTNNPLLLRIADEIAQTMDQLLWQRLRDEGLYRNHEGSFNDGIITLYVSEHRLIYESIIQGDGEAAAFYTAQHIKRAYKDIITKSHDGD